MTNKPENAVLRSTCIHTVTICDQELNFDNTFDSSYCRDCYFRCHYISWIKSQVL